MWFEPASLSSERYCGGEHHSWVRELQALELILSQNLIKPQTTDNQVQITT